MLITTSLSVYYLPKLSEIKKEIFNGYKVIMPIVIYLLKAFVRVIQMATQSKFELFNVGKSYD